MSQDIFKIFKFAAEGKLCKMRDNAADKISNNIIMNFIIPIYTEDNSKMNHYLNIKTS